MPKRSAIWLIAQGQNQVDIASAYLKEGEYAAAAEACHKAEECRGEAQASPAHELDNTMRQSLSALKIDIQITQARIRCNGSVKSKAAASQFSDGRST